MAAMPVSRPPPMAAATIPVAASEGQSPIVLVLAAMLLVLIATGVMSTQPDADRAHGQVSAETKKFLEQIHPQLYREIGFLLLALGVLVLLIFIRNETSPQ